MGTEYRKLGDFDSALIYLKKDLPFVEAHKGYCWISTSK